MLLYPFHPLSSRSIPRHLIPSSSQSIKYHPVDYSQLISGQVVKSYLLSLSISSVPPLIQHHRSCICSSARGNKDRHTDTDTHTHTHTPVEKIEGPFRQRHGT